VVFEPFESPWKQVHVLSAYKANILSRELMGRHVDLDEPWQSSTPFERTWTSKPTATTITGVEEPSPSHLPGQ